MLCTLQRSVELTHVLIVVWSRTLLMVNCFQVIQGAFVTCNAKVWQSSIPCPPLHFLSDGMGVYIWGGFNPLASSAICPLGNRVISRLSHMKLQALTLLLSDCLLSRNPIHFPWFQDLDLSRFSHVWLQAGCFSWLSRVQAHRKWVPTKQSWCNTQLHSSEVRPFAVRFPVFQAIVVE